MFRRAETNPELFRQRQRAAAAGAASAGLDLSVLGSIFLLLAKETLKVLFEQSLKFILLPVAAAANLAQAIFAWRSAYLNKFEGHSTATAVIKTITAVLISAAVIGSLVASAAFTIPGPAIFVAAFAMNTLFNLGSSIYFGVKAAMENDPYKKAEFRGKAIEAGVGTVVAAVATVGIALTMLVGKTALAIMAAISGFVGGALAIKTCMDIANQNPPAQNDAGNEGKPENDRVFSSTASLNRSLGARLNNSRERLIDFDSEHTSDDENAKKLGEQHVDAIAQVIDTTAAPEEDTRDRLRTSNGM